MDGVEAILVVAGSVWLLGWAQRWLTSRRVRLTRVARSAYAAYLLQVPVLIGLEVAARSFDWPALVKAVVVADSRGHRILRAGLAPMIQRRTDSPVTPDRQLRLLTGLVVLAE